MYREDYDTAVRNHQLDERIERLTKTLRLKEEKLIDNIVFAKDFDIEATMHDLRTQLEQI